MKQKCSHFIGLPRLLRAICMMFNVLCLFAVLIFVNAAERVSFTRFDVVQNRSLALNVLIDQSSQVEVEVGSLCRRLYQDEGAVQEEVDRCISMAFPTVRDYKLQALSKMSKGVADDATQMALQYAYEPTASHRRIFRVCAIGFPSIDSVMSILYNSEAPELWLFSRHNYKNSTAIYENFIREAASNTNKTVQFLYGDVLTLLRGLQAHSRYRLCDVLHFEDSDILGPALNHASINPSATNQYSIQEWIQDVSTVILNSTMDGGSAPDDALQIVWVRNTDIFAPSLGQFPLVTRQGKSYVPHNRSALFLRDAPRVMNALTLSSNSKDVVRWKVSSLWVNVSRITAIGNYDGFTGRSYYAPKTSELHMREVLLGEVPLSPVSALKFDHKPQPSTSVPPLAEALTSLEGVQFLNTPKDAIVVIAITFTIRVFAETAAGLRRALNSLGYAHVYIVPDLTLSAIDYLQAHMDSLPPTQENQKNEAEIEPTRLLVQIALGPHDIAMLLPHYLVFQMEQTWSIVAFTGHYKSRYALVLSNALCILAYSYVHAELLQALGYPCVQVVPLFSHTPEAETLLATNTLHDGSNEKLFDFLFYGGCSARRQALLFQIRALFPDCSEENSSTDVNSTCFRYSLHCVGWENGVFDTLRLSHVLQTRLVLNLHSDEDSVLEAHRLNYLLSLGKCVISERSGDTQLDARYASAVHFVNEGDLVTVKVVINNLLGNATALRECESQARVLYVQLSADTQNLQIALTDAVEASRLTH